MTDTVPCPGDVGGGLIGLFEFEFITCEFVPRRVRGLGPGSVPAWPLDRFECDGLGRHRLHGLWSCGALSWLAERAKLGDLADCERSWLRQHAEHHGFPDLRWVERELDLFPAEVLRWVREQLDLREAEMVGPRAQGRVHRVGEGPVVSITRTTRTEQL